MKKPRSILAASAAALIGASLLVSCGVFGGSGELRVVFTHVYGDYLNISAVLENGDGLSLNAASVIILTPASSSILLDYDSDSCRYQASLPAAQDGTYAIRASSLGLKEVVALDVPFAAIKAKPVVQDIRDSAGHSASLAESLSRSLDILIDARAVEGATGYQANVYRSAILAYSASSASSVIAIPAGSLSAGSYSVCVEAQAIRGDPLLESQAFYSVSVSDSSLFAFQAE